jgi:hypothetical protein
VSSARTKRARRLLAVETSRVAARERELAEARRVLVEREGSVVEAMALARAADARWLEVETSTELLAQASAHRWALEGSINRERQAVAVAAAEVKVREAAAIAARMSERRFEILIEGFDAADDARERKAERRTGDEHASRKTGTP